MIKLILRINVANEPYLVPQKAIVLSSTFISLMPKKKCFQYQRLSIHKFSGKLAKSGFTSAYFQVSK